MECWTNRTLVEKKSLVTLVIVIGFLIILIVPILIITEPDYCHSTSCSEASKIFHEIINPNLKPCEDFYDFVCDKQINKSQFSQLEFLKSIITEDIQVNDTKSLKFQKLFYRSCNNLSAIDSDKDKTFMDIIADLGGWPVVSGNNWNESAFDFAEFMVELREKGLQHDWFLDISVYAKRGQNIILEIDVPDNANKINKEEQKLMTQIAIEFGALENVAEAQMPEVFYFENKLAHLIEKINNHNREFYKSQPIPILSISEVQKKWQKINWLEWINHLTKKKLSDDQQVVFFVEKYMPELDKLLKQTTKRTQVNYVMWKLVKTYSPFLSAKIRDLMYNYSVATNQFDLWYKNREEFCLEEAIDHFQYSLEAEYLRRHITLKKRKNIETIIEGILNELELHFKKSQWMDETIRRFAINRLHNISYIVGGPEEMYYSEQFDKDFGIGNLELNSTNIIEISTAIFQKTLDILYNKKYEFNNFPKYRFYGLVTSDQMAFFDVFNLLWIPAGILHDFFYDDQRPNYLNFGTLGTSVAYELVHGLYPAILKNFDSSNWHNFTKATECFRNCTNDLPEFKEISCEENGLAILSDSLGINLSYQAYQKWSKTTRQEKSLFDLNFSSKQLFFLSYSAWLCHSPVPELNYNFNHMTQFRLIGAFRNSFYFSKDFQCDINTLMNPVNKCHIT